MESRVRRVAFVMASIVVLGIAALGLSPNQPVAAAGATVVTNCRDDGSATTLRVALANASSGGTVTFTPGLNCTGANAITLTGGTLTINKNLTIDGTSATIVVDGNNAVTVFVVNSGMTATLNALTIQHGVGSVIDPNDGALHGGAIYNDGTLTLSQSTLFGNSAPNRGGALYNNGTATVTATTFLNNATADSGAAIANIHALSVVNTTFAGNSATGQGGGIFMATLSTYTVTSSTFSGNTALFGGSIAGGGGGTLTNTILANPGDLGGGYSGSNNLIEDALRSGTITDGSNGNIVGHPALLGPLGNDGGADADIRPARRLPRHRHRRGLRARPAGQYRPRHRPARGAPPPGADGGHATPSN